MIEALDTQKPVSQLKAKGGESLWSIAWRKFRKHPLARTSLAILGVLYFFAAFADFFAPYPERFLNRDYTFAAPTRIRFFDEEGRLTRPYVYRMTRELNLETFRQEWTEDRSQKYPIRFFVRNNFFTPGNPNNYLLRALPRQPDPATPEAALGDSRLGAAAALWHR